MFTIGMKGSIGVMIGSIAIMLLLFGINSANNSAEQNQTMLNLQIAKETALKTENLIRLLDKATSKVIIGNVYPECFFEENSTTFETEYNIVLGDFISATGSPIECIFSSPITSSGNQTVSVSGTLECIIELGDFVTKDTRPFNFQKRFTGTTEPCTVEDVVSGCQEQPGFIC